MSVEKMFEDIRQVSGRMQERESKTDSLLNRLSSIQTRLETLKQYRSLVDSMNQHTHRTSRYEIIAKIAEEQRRIKLLKNEQTDLRTLVDEQQDAIQLIIRKLRDQLAELGELRRRDADTFQNLQLRHKQESERCNEKLHEMNAVVARASELHERGDADACARRIAKLEHENARLRDILRLRNLPPVASSCGDDESLTDEDVASAFVMLDAHAQTGPESVAESGVDFDVRTPFFADSDKRSPLNEDPETDKELLGSEKEDKRDSGCDSDE